MPWLEAFVQALDRDVIPDEGFFAEFLLDALLRGDTLARYQAYGIGIMNGVLAENEARVRENLPPFPGLWVPRRSANQDRGGNPNGPRQETPPPERRPPPDDEDESARVRDEIVFEAASRTVRKEVAAIRKQAERTASAAGLVSFAHAAALEWAESFYDRHAQTLSEALKLEVAAARDYCEKHRMDLAGRGLAVLDEWERDAPAALVELALAKTLR
jgi:hypothetical protein